MGGRGQSKSLRGTQSALSTLSDQSTDPSTHHHHHHHQLIIIIVRSSRRVAPPTQRGTDQLTDPSIYVDQLNIDRPTHRLDVDQLDIDRPNHRPSTRHDPRTPRPGEHPAPGEAPAPPTLMAHAEMVIHGAVTHAEAPAPPTLVDAQARRVHRLWSTQRTRRDPTAPGTYLNLVGTVAPAPTDPWTPACSSAMSTMHLHRVSAWGGPRRVVGYRGATAWGRPLKPPPVCAFGLVDGRISPGEGESLTARHEVESSRLPAQDCLGCQLIGVGAGALGQGVPWRQMTTASGYRQRVVTFIISTPSTSHTKEKTCRPTDQHQHQHQCRRRRIGTPTHTVE